MDGYIKKPTQEQRILEILRNACGQYVDGMIFLRLDSPITQYHARIWSLQKEGYVIEGRMVEGKNWKEYRLISEPHRQPLYQDARTPETLLNLEKAKQVSFL